MIITSQPNKLEYELNERFNSIGLTIVSAYIDGSTRDEGPGTVTINGFDTSSIGIKTITVILKGWELSDTFTITVRDLVSLSISSLPNKLAYELYEGPDWTGLTVTGTYSDGSRTWNEIIDYNNYDINGFVSSSPGEQTITVAKSGRSAAFTVVVNPPLDPETVPVSLSISSEPNKKVYELGESADWTGLEVMGTYSDGSSRVETSYDISGFDASSPGEQTITINKNGRSAAFTVTVNPPLDPETVLVSLSISSPPDKQVYELGESSDWSGLGVTGTYSDGSSRVETSYDISGFDASSPGKQTIAISKNDLSAAFTVTVRNLVSLSISSPPNKLVYELHENSDWSGLEVTGTYSDGNSKVETSYNIYSFYFVDVGEHSIIVTKGSLSAIFTITVNPPLNPETVLASLSISSLPNKLVYEQGESADWAGLEVRETYSDSSSRIETNYYNYSISGFDSSSIGEQTLTVSKNSVSATFAVTVRGLVSLSISSLPYKLAYELYESSDWTGLEVTGTYSDGSSRVETSYNIDSFYFVDVGEQSVTVSKNGVSAPSFTVTVEGLTSLSLSSEPNKKVYKLGESPDWTGLTVIGHYFIKGSQIETIDYNSEISGFDSSSSGLKTITITKSGVSISPFTIEILPGGNGAITIMPPFFQAEDITLTPAGATVTAPGGYTDYQWFVDDMPRLADSGSDGKTITLSAPEYASGTYRVWVIAHKQGLPYSGEIYLTLP
jgi:hypothetical protein